MASARRATAKDVKREATRARLLAAARRLFAEHGYSGVSTTEIAREAGVTHGMVNAHFHSKAGLLFELIAESNALQEDAARSVAESEGDCLSRLKKVIDIFLHHDLQDLELYGVMQAYSWRWPYDHERRNREQVAQALAPVRRLVEEAQAKGELRADCDPDAVTELFLAVYTHATRAALFDDATAEECAARILAQLRLALDGLRPAPEAG